MGLNIVTFSKYSLLNLRFIDQFEDPASFEKLLEAERTNPVPMLPQTDFMAPSYDQTPKMPTTKT